MKIILSMKNRVQFSTYVFNVRHWNTSGITLIDLAGPRHLILTLGNFTPFDLRISPFQCQEILKFWRLKEMSSSIWRHFNSKKNTEIIYLQFPCFLENFSFAVKKKSIFFFSNPVCGLMAIVDDWKKWKVHLGTL